MLSTPVQVDDHDVVPLAGRPHSRQHGVGPVGAAFVGMLTGIGGGML